MHTVCALGVVIWISHFRSHRVLHTLVMPQLFCLNQRRMQQPHSQCRVWWWWWCRASCPRMSVDILGTNCDQCVCMVQCCFTSTETIRLIRMESPGRPPQLSHSSWTPNIVRVVTGCILYILNSDHPSFCTIQILNLPVLLKHNRIPTLQASLYGTFLQHEGLRVYVNQFTGLEFAGLYTLNSDHPSFCTV